MGAIIALTTWNKVFLSSLGRGLLASGIILPGILLWNSYAIAQVISDGTTNTTVNPIGNSFTIFNGIDKGNNLFHSFSNFSIPTGGSASFDLTNTPNINTIFSRVTGRNVSNIDGLITTLNGNNPVSLFLMNPNGIIFGQNAKLDIGGSFLGTTANSIKFADGTEFSAVNTEALLLTMSVPVGLQMGQNSGNIQVQGQGHNLLHPNTFLAPVTRNPQQSGLRVFAGKTLALISNGIQLDAGAVIAESGHIELGSMGTGNVDLKTTVPHWEFSYNPVQSFSDINLTKAALVDASGNPGGLIHLQGKAINIENSSLVFIQNHGVQNAGNIKINADLLKLSGALPKKDQSLIFSENLGSGNGANISVFALEVIARDGGEILSTTYQNGGNGGNISVNATESIQFFGASPFDATRFSGIGAPSNTGGGIGGDVSIMTKDFVARDGAGVISRVLGGAGGGSININSESISLIGENPPISGNTSIISSTFFGGNAGPIVINTGRIELKASGAISASTSGGGNGGSLTINAHEYIDIDGSNVVLALPSRIAASGHQMPARFRQIFGLSALPTGDAGNLVINSPTIKVSDRGYIAAENVGSGNAGYLKIQADSVVLERQGQIRTSTTVGNGGNIKLTVGDILLMRNNGLVSAKAGGQGNGGNININSSIIAGLENSDIIANADKGNGGNIDINTQGIFGLKFRDQLTPESDITASSKFGVNGTVDINNFGFDPNSGLVELPENITDQSQQIATGCSNNNGSSFVATGRGGIPKNPSQQIGSDRTWSDTRDFSNHQKKGNLTTQIPKSPEVLVQATSWRHNNLGQVELIADKSNAQMQQSLSCTAVPKS